MRRGCYFMEMVGGMEARMGTRRGLAAAACAAALALPGTALAASGLQVLIPSSVGYQKTFTMRVKGVATAADLTRGNGSLTLSAFEQNVACAATINAELSKTVPPNASAVLLKSWTITQTNASFDETIPAYGRNPGHHNLCAYLYSGSGHGFNTRVAVLRGAGSWTVASP